MKRSSIAAIGLLLIAAPALLPAQTSQNFQNPGTAYVVTQSGTSIAPAASATGGPGNGPFLRLLDATSSAGTNSIAFNRTDAGGFTTIQVDFHFRMAAPGPGQGLGLGFALLNTAAYGKAGGVTGGVAGDAEEPNFTKSLGIGFDIHSDPGAGDLNANHVSVHYDGAMVMQKDAGGIALAGNQWIQAHIVIRPGGGFSDVSVTLTPEGGSPVELINLPILGLQPYEGRAYFAARKTSTDTAHHDIANVTLDFTANPAVLGQWSGVITLPIVPIHSTLLSNDKIVCWDRQSGWGGTRVPHLIDINTLDLPAGTLNYTLTPDPGFELFCSAHAITSDGKLFVAGGHVDVDGHGLDTSFLYDPGANSWTRLPDMGTGGRWYPTVTLLGNGDPVVVSGQRTPSGPNNFNDTVQVMQFSSTGTWKTLIGAQKGLPLFPYFHLAPNGKLFMSGPSGMTQYLDTSGNGSWSNVGDAVKAGRDYGGSVLYGEGKVLLLGGGSMEPGGTPTKTAEVIDLGAPGWRAVGSMAYARRMCSSLILPDGKVLVTGGSEAAGFSNDAGSILAAELWDPGTEKFTMLAGMSIARLYHSETILLPDGRVVSQGSGRGAGNVAENNAEVYSPPYLFAASPRPSITTVPSKVLHGESFQVTTPDAASVDAVTLLYMTSVTHTNNMSQRIVRPTFSKGVGSITATLPVNPNVCPPGPYLLFLLSNGVPSVGKYVLINKNLPPVAAVPGNITGPAADASGGSVTLDGTLSTDPDNAIAAYQWYEGMNLIATGPNPMVSLPIGVHSITLKVTDAGSLTSTTNFTVTIADMTAPVIQSLTVVPELLRSVNNQLVSVTLTATATDAIDPAPTTQAVSVSSSEAVGSLFPGDQLPDWDLPGGMAVKLRAERFAILRRYTVTVGATDAGGNTSTKTVDVKVRGKWFP